ncbi:hypothetical protein [Candidatus Tisiphia endosymbiont of Nemotelus uliginosus]|uniref:hypothetical protein n=1 Tax=Candidatus Tisiphia endosymbiont of Nemotelus uliginosus TaxID=3077926 RepID=UPI0035C90276
MATKSLPLIERITKLEQQKQALLNKRKDEIFKFFSEENMITIPNQILRGFLKFATDKNNKNHPTLNMFKELATYSKTPTKPKQQNHQ